MEQPAFSVGVVQQPAVSVGPNATIMTTVLTWMVYLHPVTITNHICPLKANTGYGGKDSTEAGSVLMLCGSKTAQTCHTPWPSTADACPELSV